MCKRPWQHNLMHALSVRMAGLKQCKESDGTRQTMPEDAKNVCFQLGKQTAWHLSLSQLGSPRLSCRRVLSHHARGFSAIMPESSAHHAGGSSDHYAGSDHHAGGSSDHMYCLCIRHSQLLGCSQGLLCSQSCCN